MTPKEKLARCQTCGCELEFPSARHLLDCGPAPVVAEPTPALPKSSDSFKELTVSTETHDPTNPNCRCSVCDPWSHVPDWPADDPRWLRKAYDELQGFRADLRRITALPARVDTMADQMCKSTHPGVSHAQWHGKRRPVITGDIWFLLGMVAATTLAILIYSLFGK